MTARPEQPALAPSEPHAPPATAAGGETRERAASRLLEASRRHTLDPDREVDWDAPWEQDGWFLPAPLVSLYGTPLWEDMTPEQRVELSRHEAGCHAWTLLRGESMLIQLLAQHVAHSDDPASLHVRYALTEMEDECRHSRMFARLIGKLGTSVYPRGWLDRYRTALWGVSIGPIRVFTAALIIEEVLDRFQRETMTEDSVQPVVRAVSRVHVIEEARHVSYARAELRRQMATCSPLKRYATQIVCAGGAMLVARRLVPREVYAEVGLDPREAARQARASVHRRTTLVWSAQRLTDFFHEIGVIGPWGRWGWRRARFL
ncbi:diiron oxygenase [Streptomyces sp. NPDC094032]|uniref:AurF N-oxygenase family protein n=1 Tax=Streptomyces sp. NPDC094032 TaxID=3155308 RepID=UPI00331FA72A